MNKMPTANVEIDMTQEHFSATWLTNISKNMNQNKLAIRDLEQIQSFNEVDRIIICGTGPSLNADLMRLREISDHDRETLIISNHSNTATLLYFDVVPDIIIITDSQDPTVLRLKRDVLPNFKHQLRKKHTRFILPTHVNPQLIDLLHEYNLPVFFFNMIMREDNQDPFRKFYNQMVANLTEGKVKTFCLMVGSVSNASVLVCNALKLLEKADSLEDVILSGVDYSYPNGITRCCQVTWNAEAKDFDVEERPTFLGPELRINKYWGLPTSEDQVAYYKDLRFIQWNMIEAAGKDAPFRISTSQSNFIADFLPVQAI